MANRPVVTIDVDASQFDRFQAAFAEYSAALDDMPEAWKALHEAMGDAGKESIALAAAQAGLIAEELGTALKAQNELTRSTNTAHKGFQSIGKTVKGIAGDIFGIATSVLKMGAGGLGLGVLAGGFGFDALAGSALSQLRNSNSIGLNPGQLASFKANGQQFLDMGSLQNAASVQLDPRNSGYLASLGIGYNQARNESASDLDFQMLKSAVRGWRSNPTMPYNTKEMIAYQALGGRREDVRNAIMDPNFDRDIRKAQNDTNADAAGLNISRKDADEMIAFKKQLDEAGMSINNNLIKTLAPLAPVLTELSRDFTNLAATVLGSKNVQEAVRAGTEALGDFLTKTDWPTIGKDIKTFGDGIGGVAKLFGFVLHGAATRTDADKWKDLHKFGIPGPDQVKAAKAWIDAHDTGPVGLVGNGISWLGKTLGTNAEIGIRRVAGDYNADRIHALNVLSSAKNKIPDGIMDRLAMDESGYGTKLVSGAGALGTYQFMPDTAKGYGINPLDTRQASGAAGRMLSELYSKYGAWDKTIAAYNWGSANLDKDIAAHGKDWLKYAPDETRGEVSNVVGSGARGMDSSIAKALNSHARSITRNAATKPIKVTVTNSTSSRVAVSANAAVGQ